MNNLNVIKVSELRARLAAIPGKLILAALLVVGISWDTDLATVWEHAKESPAVYAMNFFLLYGLISYVYFFIRMFHNWLIGIVVAAALVFLAGTIRDQVDTRIWNLVAMVMFFGGPVMDVLRLLRYSSLKRRVVREAEELEERIAERTASRVSERMDWQDGYGDAYERGYSRGYDRARLDAEREERLGARRHSRYEYEEEELYGEEWDSIEDDDYEGADEEREEPRGGRDFAGPPPAGFFADCRDDAAIKRRYHELCKVYHPDSGNGSEAIFRLVNEEYERLTGN